LYVYSGDEIVEDRTPLPKIKIVIYAGHPDTASTKEVNARIKETERTLSMLYLPSGNSITTRWDGKVERVIAIRESQQSLYSASRLELNGFLPLIMPDVVGNVASNRRQWAVDRVGCKGSVLIQSDGDIEKVGSNLTYGDKWLTDPYDISEFIGTWILQFQHDKLDYAGFNDRENRPGPVPHVYGGHDFPASYGKAYFKETLTFELGGS